MHASLLVFLSIWNFNFGILSKMSNMDCGKKKKTSKQKDVISYFKKPQSNNTHPIHASSSLEQVSVREMSTLLRMHLQPIQWMVEYIPLVIKVRQMHFHMKLVVQMLNIFPCKVIQYIHEKGKRANGT